MALFYDRDYGRERSRRYDRGYQAGGTWTDREHPRYTASEQYDRNLRDRWQTDYGDPFNDRGNRTPFHMTRGPYRQDEWRDIGWDRGRDRGRNFGGREWRSDYDRSYAAGPMRSDYDRNYSANPMGYDPYDNPARRDALYRGRGKRLDREQGMRRGYDRGWY